MRASGAVVAAEAVVLAAARDRRDPADRADQTTTVESPVGRLTLVARGDRLAAVLWPDDRPGRVRLQDPRPSPSHPVLQAAATQLAEYFAGQRFTFDLPLRFDGTAFQRQVWSGLLGIGYGHTCSYRALADRLGSPTASRAVGAANGRNPLSIIAPCHRVVATSGALTGFAGGLAAKAWLLAHEQRHAALATPMAGGLAVNPPE